MERSKSEVTVGPKLFPGLVNRRGRISAQDVSCSTTTIDGSTGNGSLPIGSTVSMSSTSLSDLRSSTSSNTSTASLIGVPQNPKRKSRFGSLYQSLLTSETSEGTLSPNAVRGLINPFRSQLRLPPLEIARLAAFPDVENENSDPVASENTDSPPTSTVVAALSASATSNITPPTPDESSGEAITPELDPSPILEVSEPETPPPIAIYKELGRVDAQEHVYSRPTVPSPSFFLQDENAPPRSILAPPVAAVVRPHRNPIYKTPVASKSFCPPPAVPTAPKSIGSRTQKGSTAQIRSTKKPNSGSGWRFPTETVGDKEYLIMKLIGKGGCGEVSLAMEKETRGLFAIKKVNLNGLDQAAVNECINEIKLLVELRDTNLVIHIEAWEMNTTDKTIKIVMEFGQCDLNKSISSDKTTSLNKVKSIWERMLQIVQTIHQRGIVHADLKPANFVWVGGNLKIIDFGIANKLQPDFTSIATLNPKGTLNFISPETVNQDVFGRTKISPKSDIWSLGCILHFMIFGKTPFQSIVHQMAKINAIIQGVTSYPPLPQQFEGSSILSVLQLCFQTDPKLRPTATQLLAHPFLQNHESYKSVMQ